MLSERRDPNMASESSLKYIFHHVFLPPNLPHQEDGRTEHDAVLTQILRAELQNFHDDLPSHQKSQFKRIIEMINGMVAGEDDTTTPTSKVIKNLETMKTQDICAMHVEKQNAGIIIRRFPSEYSFETFELSPKNEDLMTTTGRLRRYFPGPAVAVPQNRVNERAFQEALLHCIESLVQETPIIVHPRTIKQNTSEPETRDTIDPALVTSMLTECLHAVGRRVDVPRIQKRTRDVVQWKDCLEPWRRSPHYLFLRVCLQTGLMEGDDNEASHLQYKSFMIFFMCQILKRSLQVSKSREIVFFMSMKIQRRLLKLGSVIDSELRSQVHKVLFHSSSYLKKNIPVLPTPLHPDISVLRPEQDTELSIQFLRPYITNLSRRYQSRLEHKSRVSQCRMRMVQTSMGISVVEAPAADSLSAGLSSNNKDVRLFLADIEIWVTDHLPSWLGSHQTSELDYTALANLISIYQETSDQVYKDIPEDQSIKLLTLLDLWIALDKCATIQEPLLRNYGCGFTSDVFAPLLLPTKPQMIRLASIEKYITGRNAASVANIPCIFSTINASNSFSVRYFDQSAQHQRLRDKIIADAVAERNEKRTELETKLRAFEAWKEADILSVCEVREITRGKGADRRKEMGHKARTCPKCIAKAFAQRVTVAVHEWPLPTSESKIKSIVFELDVPKIISTWRDRTYSLLVDTFSPMSKKGGNIAYYYFEKSTLKHYVQNSHGRVRLGSQTKPFIVSHYRVKDISLATTENILKPSGLNFLVIDYREFRQAEIKANFLSHLDVRKLCTIQFTPAFAKLQGFLESTAHTTNDILAKQMDCPSTLTLHEYYQITSLRSGCHLQWMNILREVESRVLDFNRDEFFQLVAQTAWQAGFAACLQQVRDSHRDLDDVDFGTHLLMALDKIVSSVESNWQGGGALRIIAMLTTRLLSVSSYRIVQEGCLQLLLRIQLITIAWIRDVINTLHNCQEENELESIEIRALELALTCNGTFDVDMHHLKTMLESVGTQAIFVESLITVHDRCPASAASLSIVTQMCLRRFDRIAHRAERILRDIIVCEAKGINTAIQSLWLSYEAGTRWTALEAPKERWLRTKTAETDGQVSVSVEFNILTGELLINGSPLARLPRNYEAHETYKRLFGQKMLDVIPSTMPGMTFETRKAVCNQEVHFNMIGNELIVRTRGKDECFEVIPKCALINDFTDLFIENYIFMRNDISGVVQLRPIKEPWIYPENGWQITVSPKQHFYLSNGSMTAVDIRSPSAIAISDILQPLEDLRHITMIHNRYDERLEIRLPRFNLDFYKILGDSRLASKQFRGMFVDENQNIGTFTGLVNKLVLCSDDKSKRIVIIPDGEISFTPYNGHVRVNISIESNSCCAYHDYKIDAQLGRLIDNGSLRTLLFRLYLHALTSDVLPDALTGRTGTEEALEGLSSAAVLSFYTLSSSEIELLLKLRALSPKLVYYPEHKQSMQSVSWTALPTLSQHDAFSTKVESIFTYARSLIPFQDELSRQPEIPEPDSRSEVGLIYMAAIRNAVYRVDGFGAEKFTVNQDKEYNSRDGNCDANRRAAIHGIAALVDSWPQNLNVSKDLQRIMKSLPNCILGPGTDTVGILGYNTKWLDAPSEFLPDHWFAIYQKLLACDENQNKYKAMVFLSTMVFSQKANEALVHTLLAFATNPSFRRIQIPKYQYFFLSEGFEPNENSLADAVASKIRRITNTPASKLVKGESETEHQANIRRKHMYDECQERAIQAGVRSLVTQWPKEKLVASTDSNFCAYIDVPEATAVAQKLFSAWFRNHEFRKFIQQVQVVLDTVCSIEHASQPWNDYIKPTSSYSPKLTYIALKDLLKNEPPLFFNSTQFSQLKSLLITTSKSSTNENDHRKVSELLFELSQSTSGNFEAQYCNHFQQSLDALAQMSYVQLAPSSTYIFATCLHQCRLLVQRMYHRILEQLLSSISAFGATESTTMLPRLSKITIISLIAESRSIELSLQWKRAIVYFGLAMTALQRAERMVACSNNQAELLTELCNPGHEGWDPMVHPDWLLLELENGILIRKEQANISKEMIEPSSGANSVMQLNMGLGKSSVIVPIVACALADKKRLCRVVVLRALSKQMMELLVRKLGGMINRRIFLLPISRALQINVEEAKQLREIYKTCMGCGGLLLVQPEHLLSLELMGLDMALSGDKDAKAGKIINDTQAWLLQNSRDILDESDEILNVRFELIYTVGRQKPIDFAPDRWILIQRVLEIISSKVQDLDQQYQHDFELEKSPGNGSFARFRVLRPTVSDILLKRTAQYICDQGLPGLSFFRFTKKDRNLLYRFITDPKINEEELSGLQNSVFATESTKKGLLLLRGLFAHGILYFAFSQKRWRVNFGLDLKRSSLSVPYHGKDVPAARSEFSHPETSIIMTCLAYYYGGLSESQAMECFRELLKSDNSQGDYERWIRNCPDVKDRFKQLSGVNLSDFHQWCENLYVHLRRSKEMIDFYLNHLVFPKQMKEFPKKLSSSGWDIARTKNHPVTGFSGTNDSRYILPLSIQQRDLVELLSMNAEVLACLLRPENKFDSTVMGEEFNTEVLINLAITSKPAVRVILDVGAQVLELRNEEVASRWLSQLPATEVQGAVFFDSSDELCVLDRDGATEPLSVSPFAKQMDRCVIYLDEAHTRGTDLKLPANYRAIVTLGPDLNKDRLAQACMRMRKLGKGQSVVLCAPKDIRRKILECAQRTVSYEIEVKDVLLWCIKNTLDHVRKCVVPWAIQGKRHYERLAILRENPGTVPESIQEPESQSLEERYELGKEEADGNWLGRKMSNTGKQYNNELAHIRQKCIDFNTISFAGASFHEEQERELEPEREMEVQPEHAPRVPARAHSLHPDVKELVMTGTMKRNNAADDGFIPAFNLFRVTSAKKLFDGCKWPESLWITSDYAQTVIMAKSDENDFFLRPVHWIVTFKQKDKTCCVVFSPFEVQELRSLIEKYKKVTLSIYSPRLSLSLRSFESLDVHTVPPLQSSWTIPSSIMQLNLFAGQLYLRSYDEYIRLCQFLGLCHYPPQDDVEIACDSFVRVSSRAAFDPVMEEVCPFVQSPVGFLQKVFALRRKGQSFEDTHMGRILNGELLTRKDFDDEESN